MADLSVTAASVVVYDGATIVQGTAGATITAGQPLYKDSTAGYVLKTCDTDASAAASACVGIALHAAASGQPIDYAVSGPVNVGATLTVGQVYIVSATAGGIAPVSDLTTGYYTTVLGIAATASKLLVNIQTGGVAKA